MRYLTTTAAQRRAMLETIGADDIEALLERIPGKARLGRDLTIPPALAEGDLIRHLAGLAEENAHTDAYVSFLGAGAYDHYAPSMINHMLLRSEYFTAYTPYQPEASQGTLRTIYEYQTMVCELTGMDVANASLYDGGSALAEAALMAHSAMEREEVVVSGAVSPLALALLRPPGEVGADLVVGEGQGLGSALNFGGPYLGLFACRKELVRRMPGRLVGATVDSQGRRGFVLTLQTREQHIRREKATSNICTNSGLIATVATAYMCLMGPQGLKRVADICYQRSHYLAKRIAALPGYRIISREPFFK